MATPEYDRDLVINGVHSPNRFRVNGPLSNMPEFAEAFSCKTGDRMVRPASERCRVW
jgi:predicted metalloendopeptidase